MPYKPHLQEITPEEAKVASQLSASFRPRERDTELTTHQKIDRLISLYLEFPDVWAAAPWLVLTDGWTVQAFTAVPGILQQIAAHGEPIGLVGLAVISARRWTCYRQHFKTDKKSRALVEKSATEAEKTFIRAMQSINPLEGQPQ
jgi:hypothetical protein